MTGYLEIESYKSGKGYRVEHNGAVLVEFCKDPFPAGAKALIALGVDLDDKLVLIDGVSKMVCLTARIGFIAAQSEPTGKDD